MPMSNAQRYGGPVGNAPDFANTDATTPPKGFQSVVDDDTAGPDAEDRIPAIPGIDPISVDAGVDPSAAVHASVAAAVGHNTSEARTLGM